jgi:hypothetical protein
MAVADGLALYLGALDGNGQRAACSGAADGGTLESVRIRGEGARMRAPSAGGRAPDKTVLIMRFHPVGGEDVTVVCGDFSGESEALEAALMPSTSIAAWS